MRARLIFLALVGVVVLGGLPAHALAPPNAPPTRSSTPTGTTTGCCSAASGCSSATASTSASSATSSASAAPPAGARSPCRTPGTPATTPTSRWSAASPTTARTSSSPAARSAATGSLRFESVNYRATVYLNGKEIGEHTGAYLPFEFALNGVKKGVNRLVVRVDNVRQPFDFPPSGFNDDRRARGRLVELRRHHPRGLPAQGLRRHRLRQRPGAPDRQPRPACAGAGRVEGRRPQLGRQGQGGQRHGELRRPEGQPRLASTSAAGGTRRFTGRMRVAQPAPVVARTTRSSTRVHIGGTPGGLHAAHRRALDQRSRRTGTCCSTASPRTSAASASTRTRSTRARRSTTPRATVTSPRSRTWARR